MGKIQNVEERRLCSCELRKQEGGEESQSRTVEGYAAVYNSLSEDLGGFIERIDPGAFDGVVETSDVFAYLNHDSNRGVLARSKYGTGSLELFIDDKGLGYRFEAPATALGDELLEGLRRGEIDSSSFAFSVEDAEWFEQADGVFLRVIKKIKQLYDVSPVWSPAYAATTCDKRGMDAIIEERSRKSSEYYQEFENRIKLV